MAARFSERRHEVALIGRSRECDRLNQVAEAVRAGESRVLVLWGEPGVGKTALLDYLAGRASGLRVVRATGIQSEMELAFAAIHQLCAQLADGLEGLPAPQRKALRIAFGIDAGPVPDRFVVGLAMLSLLSEAAAGRPLVCLVDDEQWLDRASAQVLAFVARRLGAEPVGLVFSARRPGAELSALPDLMVGGLRDADARMLLDSVLTGPLDARVRDQIVTETHGNPLALVELARGLAPEELAGGFGLPGLASLSGRIEESFRRRVEALPPDSRRLLLVAAADPTGEPVLVWQAAGRLAIAAEAAIPAAEADLVEFGTRVRFRHPLVRSAAYKSASRQQRHEVHLALAQVTDPQIDPDRRAWHRAQAAPGPDAEVADELALSADRAQARGGLAAAAAFLERAAMLTPEPARRAQRLLAAAKTKRDAGALDAALGLLVAVEAGPLDPLRSAEIDHLRGQIAVDQLRVSDAARLLLSAATRLEPLDPAVARETHLEALGVAMWGGDLDSPGGVRAAAAVARAAPPVSGPPRAVDILLDALATRFTDGYAAAAPALTQALKMVLAMEISAGEVASWIAAATTSAELALELWDSESAHALASRLTQVSRHAGALVSLQFALNLLAGSHIVAGELDAAARVIEEDRLIADVTGNRPATYSEMMLAAWRGREANAAELIEATMRQASARGLGGLANLAAYAGAVLHNGLGRHDLARDSAWRAFERDQLGYGPFVVPELAEAASRTGDVALVRTALEWLHERTEAAPNDWLLGIEARVHALLSEGDTADRLYRESVRRLGRTRVRAQLARSHLLYGEWLRRERRRGDARVQLHTAHDMLDGMGIEAFAERARRELLATGETARKRSVETSTELTAQEAQVASLARNGLSNPEIGARLFISTRTVQYHLSKVFAKLGISSRSQLDRALQADPDPAGQD